LSPVLTRVGNVIIRSTREVNIVRSSDEEHKPAPIKPNEKHRLTNWVISYTIANVSVEVVITPGHYEDDVL
jgi:hypothetical protein